jgi:hypothetical protein
MGAVLDPVLKIFRIGTGSGDWSRVVLIGPSLCRTGRMLGLEVDLAQGWNCGSNKRLEIRTSNLTGRKIVDRKSKPVDYRVLSTNFWAKLRMEAEHWPQDPISESPAVIRPNAKVRPRGPGPTFKINPV